MQIDKTGFPGLYILTPKVYGDDRGFFMETYSRRVLADSGLEYDFIQTDHARSEDVDVLRGLHFQLPPMAQTKLVRVSRGAVMDVVVDLRVGSPCYGKWHAEELTAKNNRQLLIPKGFAHAYKTLESGTEFQYKVDTPYAPEQDAGIRWDDPDIGIQWPGGGPILSDKDKTLPLLADFVSPFIFDAS